MAPAAYAKALNSTSNSAHAFGSTAGSNESDVEKQSAYAFSPSWLNNSTVRSLTQLSHTRDVPNTFEKNFPTLATNAAEDKQSSAGSVWGNRNLTKEKVISARSPVEEGGPHSSRHNNEHNVQLEKLKALVPKIETKKRSSSSRTKPSLHSARATSLPAQFSRSSSTMSLKSLSTASPPPSANSTPITPKKLAVFRSSQVRQISPVEAKDHSNSPVLETKRFDQESIPVDLHEATKITKLQGLNQSEETSSHHHMDFDEGSRKPNDEAHWRMSSTEYADVYGTHSDDVAIPESHQSSRSETTAYLKDYPGIESEPVYTMAEQLRFLELMRNWTGGSERWENNCGGISISMPSTPRRTPSDLSNKLDDEDQSSVFGSRDSSPGHRSQSSISSLGRLGNTQYSHFGQGSLQMSSGDYTYNQAPLLTPDTQTMYQHLSYINPSDSMVNTDLFNTRPSIDRGQDYQKVPPIYGRHDPYYGQLGLNDEQQHVFNNRTLSHPINRHRPGVYHA
ncbi:hypothetical protein Unana1_00964 [Umbelopsis nana]